MPNLINARVLKGFRDFLPEQEIARKTFIEALERVFRSFGFVPIDTPALEYAEILLGKGGGETDKQIYRFSDNGGRDVALRFDLTVPFARFAAEHRAELAFPFKRYHIGKVWRGENTQKGRYREFTQCDFDIIGSPDSGSASARGDFEVLLLIKTALAACNAGELTVSVNHRGLFNLFLKQLGAQDKLIPILHAVDKLAKAGRDSVLEQLTLCAGKEPAEKILEFIDFKGSWEDTVKMMTEAAGGENPYSERLREIYKFIVDSGCGEALAGEGSGGERAGGCFRIDPSITRGLDYYTGIVFETFLKEQPGIGSVCSGGRYDNLISLYSKETLSGVGASIGLDRLIAALETKLPSKKTYSECAVICLEAENYGKYQSLAAKLRAAGVAAEVLTEVPKDKLSAEFIAAEKRGVPRVIIPSVGGDGGLTLRDLKTRTNREDISIEEIINLIMKNPVKGAS